MPNALTQDDLTQDDLIQINNLVTSVPTFAVRRPTAIGTAAPLETLRSFARGYLERKEFVEDGDAMDIGIRSPKSVDREVPGPQDCSSLYSILRLPGSWAVLSMAKSNFIRIFKDHKHCPSTQCHRF
ncbi:hypothetical protein FOMA001_g13250 [Fusarium oxysporum f. sp. matthiolae]|nr:hypothetical protein FOMA001_g13250 [Fusarium oxysporum f. sp. matthiolae]